jgi:hypothetical protein
VDLPVHVGVDLFREIISRYNYDEIYRPRGNDRIGMNEIRARLGYEMRNRGVLACRPVFHSAGTVLRERQEYPVAELLTVPPQNACCCGIGRS